MMLFLSITNFLSSIRHMDGVSLTFVRLELLLHEAELFFGLPQFVLESGNLSRAGIGGQQQCLFNSYRQILLASCVLF